MIRVASIDSNESFVVQARIFGTGGEKLITVVLANRADRLELTIIEDGSETENIIIDGTEEDDT